MNGNHARNKERAKFRNTDPSMTDQSQAADTDINVIVKRYTATGMLPEPQGVGAFADMTKIPQDLRGLIETSRSIEHYRNALPPQLRAMPMEQLLTLTNDELEAMFKPVETNNQPKDEPKT